MGIDYVDVCSGPVCPSGSESAKTSLVEVGGTFSSPLVAMAEAAVEAVVGVALPSPNEGGWKIAVNLGTDADVRVDLKKSTSSDILEKVSGLLRSRWFRQKNRRWHQHYYPVTQRNSRDHWAHREDLTALLVQ